MTPAIAPLAMIVGTMLPGCASSSARRLAAIPLAK